MFQANHIVVVGGGSIGVSFVHQLVRDAAEAGLKGVRITVVEKSGRAGGGEAYQNDLSTNLLNTRADTMSATRGRSHEFLNWLRAREADWRPEFPDVEIEKGAYLPRPLFGRYLESVFAETERQAVAAEIELRLVRGEALDVAPRAAGFEVVLTDGTQIEADFLMLCPGNLPSNAFPHLEGTEGYFNSPYPLDQITVSIDQDAPVGVIGSSLSAIDTLVGLSHQGHIGKLVCASRRGRLPSVRGQNNRRYHPEILTVDNVHKLAQAAGGQLTLEEAAQLIVKEIEHVDDHPFDLSDVLNQDAGAYDYLQTEIALAQGKERLWQSAIYSLNGVIDTVWHYLAEADKARFMRDYRSLWLSYRVSFPVQNALRLQQMMRTDRFTLLSGLKSVDYDPSSRRFLLECIDPRSGLSSMVRTPYVINATGYTSDVKDSSVPLIRNLLSRNLARPSPYTGFEVDFDTGTVQSDSPYHSDHLYALGALAAGTWLFTNAFDVNVRYAGQAAHRIVTQMEATSQIRHKMADRHATMGQELH
jgi:uncharacterized NAD(P)/FAD-binding protein YdhS